MSLLITKSDGTTEAFDPAKLTGSLKKAGANDTTAHAILADIEAELRPGMTTSEIYSHAFTRLHQDKRGSAARYSLKRAVLDFGPSGFPFEMFVAELYRSEGYTADVDQIIQGGCVAHEVDMVAVKDGVTTYAEAKFHNSLAFKTDLKVVLYVKARMEDIIAKGRPGARGLVVTNTKFTDMARQYAECQLLELLSWDYPEGATLNQRIERAGLYPITALTTLSKRQKTALLMAKIVLCNTLLNNMNILASMGITGKKAENVLEEVGVLCSPARVI